MSELNGSRHRSVRRPRRGQWLGVCGLLLATTAGCRDYDWHWDFSSQEELTALERSAREQNKYLFVFYKYYLDGESNRMHGDVLADNKVGVLFKETVNIVLDKSGGALARDYMRRYGVTSPPAFVIVAPDGRPSVHQGAMSKEDFIAWVKQAMSGSAKP